MALDVEVPDPPPLSGPQSRGAYDAIDMTDQDPEDDYRREEIETILADGAWQDAFEEWATLTYLSERDFEVVLERGLLDQFDFYWDPATDEVGYRVPPVEAGAAGAFEDDPDEIEAELDSLARVVSETLENDYLLRDDDEFGFFAEEYTGEDDEDREE